MTMHHEANEKKSALPRGSIVRATKRVVDADAADTRPDRAILSLLDRGGGPGFVDRPAEGGSRTVDGKPLPHPVWRSNRRRRSLDLLSRRLRKEPVVYPGMNDQKKSGVFHVKPVEGGVALSINATVSPPQRTMFADYVQVDRTRDGVTLVFGKCELGPNPGTVRNVLDISFPRRSFLNQLYQSVIETQSHQREPFIATARRIVGEFGYERIVEQPVLPATSHAGSIRANAAFFALFEDDAAIDFFHLDAQVLHALSRTGNVSSLREVKGIIRIVVSPPILDYLLTRCGAVAETLTQALQSAPDVKQLSQG